MSVITIGLNHTTAPVDVRERIAIAPDDMADSLRAIRTINGVEEAALLSTCNRTEMICWSNEKSSSDELTDWLANYRKFDRNSLESYLYQYHDSEAIHHILRVACGLDSMILGENEILGQLKSAYKDAVENESLGKYLERLFQHSFASAKRVRTETAIGDSPVSVAYAAVTLAERIFTKLEDQTALLIGAGETIELAARHLQGRNLKQMIIANRTLSNAEKLASSYNAEAIPMSDISNRLHEADIVISATASPTAVIGKGAIERALKQRRRKPIFIVDIAVPRDVEPQVAQLDDVYLYTVDDLQNVISDNLKARRSAAVKAEALVLHDLDDFLGWLRSQSDIETMLDLRATAELKRDQLLQQHLQQLEQGKPPAEVLEKLAGSLTNTLIHEPTKSLGQAARDGDKSLLNAAKRLFNLDKES